MSENNYNNNNRYNGNNRPKSNNGSRQENGESNNKNSTPKKFNSFNQIREKKPVFMAICADCNKECDLPFKPTHSKPVYCRECFRKQKD